MTLDQLIDRILKEIDAWRESNPAHPLIVPDAWWLNLRSLVVDLATVRDDPSALAREYDTIAHIMIDGGPGMDVAPSLDALRRYIERD